MFFSGLIKYKCSGSIKGVFAGLDFFQIALYCMPSGLKKESYSKSVIYDISSCKKNRYLARWQDSNQI
jgi:hypothetical protein